MDTIKRIIHEQTGLPEDQITNTHRTRVKTLNFASAYGSGEVCGCLMTIPQDEDPTKCIYCRKSFAKEAPHAAR